MLFNLRLPQFSEFVSKPFDDVTKAAWTLCYHKGAVGSKGLNQKWVNGNFVIYSVFGSNINLLGHLRAYLGIPRSFEFFLNPLIPNLFRKITYFILFSCQFQKFIKPLKMVLRSPFKNENVANFMLFNLRLPEFSEFVSKPFYAVTKAAWTLC